MKRLIRRYVLLTLVLLLVFSVPYAGLICQPPANLRSGIAVAIEALNYSVQTVTTIGYGNWSSDSPCDGRVKITIPFVGDAGKHVSGIRLLKLISAIFMLVGAGIFAITLGLAVEWIKQRTPPQQETL